MRILFFILIELFLVSILHAQIINGDFDEWEMRGTLLIPSDITYIYTFPKGTFLSKDNIEKIEVDGNYENIVKLTVGKNQVGNINFGQFSEIKKLSVHEKGSLHMVLKYKSTSEHNKLRLGWEEYPTYDNTNVDKEIYIDKDIDEYEDIIIDTIRPLAEGIHFWISINCSGKEGFCQDTTSVWIDRVYIAPRELEQVEKKEKKPSIIHTGDGFRIEAENMDEYTYQTYAIDGRLILSGKATSDKIYIPHSGAYVITLTNESRQKHYTYKMVFFR